VQNVLDWLNPFNPAGFNIFAWIQLAENTTRAKARRVIRASHSTKEDPEAPEIGDAVYFGCIEGESVNGNANGARGFSSQILENGDWDPPLPENGCLPIKYHVSGSVIHAVTNLPVSGVKLEINVGGEEGKLTTQSDAYGAFEFEVPGGNYTITASQTGMLLTHKAVIVATDIEPDTDATIYMGSDPSSKAWTAVVSFAEGQGMIDSYTKWGMPQKTVWFGNVHEDFKGVSATVAKGGGQMALDGGYEGELPEDPDTQLDITIIEFDSDNPCEGVGCDVKFMVNGVNIEPAGTIVTLFHGKTKAGTFDIKDCSGSLKDSWWHVFTLNSDKLKFDCRDGGEAFLQEAGLHFNRSLPGHLEVDFDSYVGPFPGRFWRHSRRLARKNTTRKSSFLPPQRGADASPKKLRVGASDVDVKPTNR